MIILVFLFYSIIVIVIIIITGKLEIQIYDLSYIQNRQDKKLKYLTKIKFKIFGKITILSIKINDKMFKSINKIDKNFIKNPLEAIKKFKINVKKIDLKIGFGIDDVIVTSLLIAIISTLVSNLLRKIVNTTNGNKYEIMPIYNLDKKGIKINIYLKCIFDVNMIHIIYIWFIIKKEGEKNGRASNRRAYDNSNE